MSRAALPSGRHRHTLKILFGAMMRLPASLRSPTSQIGNYFGIVMVLLLWVGIEHILGVRREAGTQTATQNVANLSRIFEEHISRALRETDKTLLLLRTAHDNAPDKFDLRAWVGTSQFRTELAVQYAFIGPDGYMIATNLGPVDTRVDLSDREHFKVHRDRMSDELFVSKPVLGRASGKWSIQLTRAIRDIHGGFGGVLVASIDPYYLARLYEHVDLGHDGAITLVGFDGIIRARGGEGPNVLGKSMRNSAIFSHYEKHPRGVIMGSGVIDGVRRLLSYRVVSGFPLIVVAAMSEQEILSNYRDDALLYRTAGVVLTILIAMFIAAGINSKRKLQLTLLELAERRDSAEQASRTKSSFLAVMSHEIRTPMNAVLGLTSSLLEGELTPEQRRVLKTIHESGDSLLEILNDILDYSKLESGNLSFELIPFAVQDIAQSAVDIIGPRASAKGLYLTVLNDPSMPHGVVGDAGRLRQVLINLVSNAVKFTSTGRVTVSCRCVERTESEAELEWAVSDTGIGIAPDKIGKLFRDFAQADCSINRRFGGSGLGLSICKRIVEAMKGRIEAESTFGAGTTVRFAVKLPISTLKTESDQTLESSADQLKSYIRHLNRPLRVLIADDNPTNRIVAAKMLQEFDPHIVAVADGTEAVDAVKRREFDVVLMDVRMPDMDGLEATRAIRQLGMSVPIIAFTANAFADDIEATRHAGMSDFVAKPVRKPVLLDAMMRCLGRSHTSGQPPKLDLVGDATAIRCPDFDVPLLDAAAFDALAGELDGAIDEALQSFRQEMSERLARMATADLCDGRAVIEREAHTIKGSSATFGLRRCSEIARWLEKNAKHVEADEYRRVLELMRRAYGDALPRIPIAVAA